VISGHLIVTLERLRDSLGDLRKSIRDRLARPDSQVTASDLRDTAAKLAEKWLTTLAVAPEIVEHISSDYLADLNVHFQRLLSASEKATLRSKYEAEIRAILHGFTLNVVVPMKRARANPLKRGIAEAVSVPNVGEPFRPSAFLGHSFATEDKIVADCVRETLESIGVKVVTGEKPEAESISEKVKRRIEAQHIFVGLFTRREKIVGKKQWATSGWIIDEKAYALGKSKKLILLKEDGVVNIGGLQGDHEYIEFTRDRLDFPLRRLLQLFDIRTTAFRSD
jgi:hypothetical protein